HDDVGGAAAQRDLSRLGRGELDRRDREVGLTVEPVGADDVELPCQRPGLLHGNANRLGGRQHRPQDANRCDPYQCQTEAHHGIILGRRPGVVTGVRPSHRLEPNAWRPIMGSPDGPMTDTRPLWLAVPWLTACALCTPALADDLNDYPTAARADYVFAC